MSERAWLLFVAGPHLGARFAFDRTAVVGRGPQADARLVDDKSVSGVHARIEQGRDGWQAVDFGAPNGVLLNGQPVRRAARIVDGDRLQFGHSEARFCLREPGRVFDVRRRGAWLTFNETRPGRWHAVSVDDGRIATAFRFDPRFGPLAVLPGTVEMEWAPRLLDKHEDIAFLEDMAGVAFEDVLRDARESGASVDLQLLVHVALASLEALPLSPVAPEVRLTFDGRVLLHGLRGRPRRPVPAFEAWTATLVPDIRARLQDVLERGDVRLVLRRLRALQEDVSGPPRPEWLAGLVRQVFPRVVAEEEALREEVGVLGVEGLLSLVE
jgi:hypothetical protein